jgi:hypothetical protein
MVCAMIGLQSSLAVRIQAGAKAVHVSQNPSVNITIFTRDINVTGEISWR